MRKLFILLALIGYSLHKIADAQEIDKGRRALELSHYGEFIKHPVLAVGLQYAVVQREIFDVHGDFNFGAFWHKWNHNTCFAQTKLGTRFIGKRGFCTDLGSGYMLTSANGDVYSADENAEIKLTNKPINKHLAPTGSIIFGWDFSKKKDKPLMLQCGIESFR